MIYTVTLNPSIDYVVYPDDPVQLGQLNRISKNHKYPGGKGINVSRILSELAIESTALGFVGGFTGDFLKQQLQDRAVSTAFVEVEEDTRINVKIKGESETEINGAGPHITPEKQAELVSKFRQLKQGDIVVLAGSKPSGLPGDFYQQLIRLITEKGASFIIDTTGDELMQSLEHQPFLIKPNSDELEELYETVIDSKEAVVQYGRDLLNKGARNVIVSMGKDGAMLFTHEGIYHGSAKPGRLVNSVGAGDSMVAGFTGTFEQTKDIKEAFRYSLACGSATAFSEDLAVKEDIEKVLQTITIKQWEE